MLTSVVFIKLSSHHITHLKMIVTPINTYMYTYHLQKHERDTQMNTCTISILQKKENIFYSNNLHLHLQKKRLLLE